MRSKKSKAVQVSIDHYLAQRLTFIRRFKHRLPDLNRELEDALRDVIEKSEKKAGVQYDSWKKSKPCPSCTNGVLFPKVWRIKPDSKPFMGCSRFPECRHTESFT